MARYGITYEEVADAADQVLRQGQNPTMQAVRDLLGTGSFATLSKHLNTWKSARLMSAVREAPQSVIPSDKVTRAVESVWEQMNNQAQAEIDKIREETEQKIVHIEEEKELLRTEKEALQESFEKAKLKINHLETDDQLRQAELIDVQKQNAVFEVKLRQSEADLKRFQEDAQKHVKELEHNYQEIISYLKTQLEENKKYTRQETEQLRELLENQRQKFMVDNEHLKTAKEKTEKTVIKLEADLKNEEAKGKVAIEEAKGCKVDLKVSEQQLKESELLVASLKGEAAQKNAEVIKLNKKIEILEQKLEDSFKAIGSLKNRKKVNKS